MGEHLKPFNANAKCPKCGSEHVGVRHLRTDFGGSGVMVRTCGTCGYSWKEAPLDDIYPNKETHRG